ncbi:sulfite exporter TauE/SafE family protein [Candidatus Woesearchaeota archaeon]|nr:sulfite exporter TauE/SafE family protein [Candidatus Woesearchaeota archaeon]
MKKLNLNVKGMTCASCEVLLERGMKKVPGVHKVQVSRSKEKAYIRCDNDVNIEDLQAAVADKGYTLIPHDAIDTPIRPSFIVKNKKKYAEIGAVLLFIVGAYFILNQFDLLPKSLGITDNMSYGFVFVIGLVAATSTCLAVAGGLLLAVANKHNEANPHLTGRQKFQPHIWFNIGRIASYVLLGGLIGALGSVLSISPKVTGIITIIASVFMIIMGVQLLQIFPWMNKIQLKMPKFIAHKIYDASHQEQSKKAPGKLSSFLFGGSTFFLPCGFTQALQLYVLGTGDFVTGALVMLAFSLGTLPALAGIGAFTSFAKGKTQRHFTTFSAVLVIMLGIFALPNGMVLAGANVGDLGFSATSATNIEGIEIVDGFQIVKMKVESLDYYPNKFQILEGVPVRWEIDGRNAQGCAQVISVPSKGITEFLPQNDIKVIEFTPDKVGKIRFSCTMGMAGPGVFDVIPNTQGIKGAELQEVQKEQGCNPEFQQCNVQKVQMEISREKGFYPNDFEVQQGVPVELEIDAKLQLGGCMGTMVLPKYGVTHVIPKGKSTLKFTPTEKGIVDVTCSMGSKQAQFRVI